MPCSTWDSPYQAFRPLTASSAAPVALAVAVAASCMAGPHIGFDDFGILRHRLVIACGEDLAAAQYGRSEVPTSEFQSLMRIPYAVFCLTKKTCYSTHHSSYRHPHRANNRT